jgi:uncharacterized membrane protein YeaQ/YmgE (transglycosylase-associated protein family)
MSGANTLFNMVQQMGMAMGIALGAVALRLAALLRPGAGSSVPGAISLAHFHLAFVLIGAVALLEVFDVLRLDHRAGDGVRAPAPV